MNFNPPLVLPQLQKGLGFNRWFKLGKIYKPWKLREQFPHKKCPGACETSDPVRTLAPVTTKDNTVPGKHFSPEGTPNQHPVNGLDTTCRGSNKFGAEGPEVLSDTPTCWGLQCQSHFHVLLVTDSKWRTWTDQIPPVSQLHCFV